MKRSVLTRPSHEQGTWRNARTGKVDSGTKISTSRRLAVTSNLFLELGRLVAEEAMDAVVDGDARELLLVDVGGAEARERAWREVRIGEEDLP